MKRAAEINGIIPEALSNVIPDLVAVGGCVRDTLMGNTPKDVDLASPIPPNEMMSRFKAADIRVIPTGLKYGTITAVVDDEPYEITTFRIDTDPDGRRSEVEYTTDLRKDLARRDFTINAMAMTEDGEVIDPFGGRVDIRSKIIRVVGSPQERFSEDLLRIIRAARFASRLGFGVEPQTRGAMLHMATHLQEGIDDGLISMERVMDEFNKAFSADDPSEFLQHMWDMGIVQHIIPEMKNADELEQDPRYHPEGSVWNHLKEAVDRAAPEYRWHALLHDVGKCLTHEATEEGHLKFHGHEYEGAKVIEEIGRRLRLSVDLIRSIEATTANHMTGVNVGPERPSNRHVRRLQHRIGPHLEALQHVMRADAGPRYQRSWDDFFVPMQDGPGIDPALKGRHLIERGMEPGPHFGPILDRALQHQLDTGETDVDVLFELAIP